MHLCAGTTQLFLSNTFYFRNYALRTREILFTFSLRTTQRVQTYIHISLRKKLSNLKHNLYETFQSCAQLRNFDFQIYFTFATTHYAPPKYFLLFLLRTTQSLQTYIHLQHMHVRSSIPLHTNPNFFFKGQKIALPFVL